MALPRTRPDLALVDLDRVDLTVLDLGLSYLVDAVREDPDVLPAAEEKAALAQLHQHVLTLKRGGS